MTKERTKLTSRALALRQSEVLTQALHGGNLTRINLIGTKS